MSQRKVREYCNLARRSGRIVVQRPECLTNSDVLSSVPIEKWSERLVREERRSYKRSNKQAKDFLWGLQVALIPFVSCANHYLLQYAHKRGERGLFHRRMASRGFAPFSSILAISRQSGISGKFTMLLGVEILLKGPNSSFGKRTGCERIAALAGPRHRVLN